MNYKLLNTIKTIPFWIVRIAIYPIKILALIIYILVGFFIIDWTQKWERDFFKEEMKKCYKL